MPHVIVTTTLPDRESADTLARSLVADRLAACVSIGASVTSIYHWRGAIETSTEVPVTIKTRSDLLHALADAIRARHPYELPEILAVTVSDGSDEYLGWIDAETRAP